MQGKPRGRSVTGHANKADRLLIKPTAGARPASPRTPGHFIPKARSNSGLTLGESQAARTTTSLATAPDGPTKPLSQTLVEPGVLSSGYAASGGR